MSKAMARVLQWGAIVLLTVILPWPTLLAWHRDSASALPDFGDFYCAGAARNAGGDPYLWKALDECGRARVKPEYGAAIRPKPAFVPVAHRPPAPIPGYDVGLFRVIAHLPYGGAALLWLIGSAFAVLAATYFSSELTGFPPLIVFAALYFPTRDGFSLGQFAPFLLAALAYAAYAVKRERYVSAALVAATMLIEPHMGVPVCLAMFLWLPRTRVALAASAGVLVACSLAAVGLRENLDFFRIVLPVHVAAEAPATWQYSLTWVLYFFGMPEALAVKLATLSYYASVALGVYVTRKMPREFVPVVPVAFAAIGGPFIHVTQVQIAVVAALMLAAYYQTALAWAAVALFSVVWANVGWQSPHHELTITRLGSCVVMALVASYAFRSRRIAWALPGGVCAAAAYFGITRLIMLAPSAPFRYPEAANFLASTAAYGAYTNVPWGLNVHLHTGFSTAFDLIEKIPLWIALGLVAYECAWHAKRVAAREERTVAPIARYARVS